MPFVPPIGVNPVAIDPFTDLHDLSHLSRDAIQIDGTTASIRGIKTTETLDNLTLVAKSMSTTSSSRSNIIATGNDLTGRLPQ